MYILPGVSHHDIPKAECYIHVNPSYNTKQSRKIYNFKKIDWEKLSSKGERKL